MTKHLVILVIHIIDLYYVYIYIYLIWMGNSPTKISDITNPETTMFALLVSCS